MVEDCFSEEPPDDDGQIGKEDKSFEVIRPWFKQPHAQSQFQPRPEGPRGVHMSAKAVLRQLVTGKDDLPACLIFYPISNQPHSIQGTWLAGKGEDRLIY